MNEDTYVRTLDQFTPEASVFAKYLEENGRVVTNHLIDLNIGGYYIPDSNDEGYINFAIDMLYVSVLCGLASFNYDEDEGCGVFTWGAE